MLLNSGTTHKSSLINDLISLSFFDLITELILVRQASERAGDELVGWLAGLRSAETAPTDPVCMPKRPKEREGKINELQNHIIHTLFIEVK